MASVRAPPCTSAASVACSSTGPGVVRLPVPGSSRPAASMAPRVPMEAAGAASPNRWRSRWTVVVLPLVPVTASSRKARAGSP